MKKGSLRGFSNLANGWCEADNSVLASEAWQTTLAKRKFSSRFKVYSCLTQQTVVSWTVNSIWGGGGRCQKLHSHAAREVFAQFDVFLFDISRYCVAKPRRDAHPTGRHAGWKLTNARNIVCTFINRRKHANATLSYIEASRCMPQKNCLLEKVQL